MGLVGGGGPRGDICLELGDVGLRGVRCVTPPQPFIPSPNWKTFCPRKRLWNVGSSSLTWRDGLWLFRTPALGKSDDGSNQLARFDVIIPILYPVSDRQRACFDCSRFRACADERQCRKAAATSYRRRLTFPPSRARRRPPGSKSRAIVWTSRQLSAQCR